MKYERSWLRFIFTRIILHIKERHSEALLIDELFLTAWKFDWSQTPFIL